VTTRAPFVQLSFAVLLVVLGAEGSAQDTSSPPALPAIPATLADVAFMAGHWIGGDPGDLSEEVWSAPEGDSMMGMWRYVAKGQTQIYEILTLTKQGENVVLRIRHFNPKLVAREEKDRAVELPLVSKSQNEAIFEGPEYNVKGNVRLTYRRPTPDTLTGVLEKEGKQQVFSFRRR
jgi:Domain of unknown function (DUF6265)